MSANERKGERFAEKEEQWKCVDDESRAVLLRRRIIIQS